MQFGFDGSTDEAGAFAEDGDGDFVRVRFAGRAAFPWRGGNCSRAPGAGSIDLRAPRGEFSGDRVGEGEIDVVAAEQDVLADGHALELQFAVLFGDGDEREVGGAAADIDDEDEIAFVDALPPVGMALDPGVEGGLRLFEQGEVFEAGGLGGALR